MKPGTRLAKFIVYVAVLALLVSCASGYMPAPDLPQKMSVEQARQVVLNNLKGNNVIDAGTSGNVRTDVNMITGVRVTSTKLVVTNEQGVERTIPFNSFRAITIDEFMSQRRIQLDDAKLFFFMKDEKRVAYKVADALYVLQQHAKNSPKEADDDDAQSTASLNSQLTPVNLPPANKLTIPNPIAGNSGNYMSPFTASGAVAFWAQEVEAGAGNGSDVSADIGGSVGKEVGKQVLKNVPLIGGLIGSELGKSVAGAATRKTIQPKVPSAEEAKATSDISFNTSNELAVYMYAKYSNHQQYARILALTQKVYPELTRVYVSAIEQAAQPPEKVAQGPSKPEFKKAEIREKLEALNELKGKGLITEAEFQAKRSKILEAL